MPMFDPPHPGEIVREECLIPNGLTVTEAAQVLGVSRQTMTKLLNEKGGITPEMAIRLEKAFGGEADFWLKLQTAFDLAQARRHQDEITVTRFVPKAAPQGEQPRLV
ncbi:HigA family addiction module antitoxin [Jiella marina]|uniref:HigA family addiction module antitoxin n=1 Tax=Jiella sp. LLJ827 TaxID=2917712 RepID=UPI002100C43E|nr:HigA family addiction module antitoxin [Jiella sp. LLJ827]MCQ0990596.1 HigA family addiction module antitoxin [Jiella sp. LLJ827]